MLIAVASPDLAQERSDMRTFVRHISRLAAVAVGLVAAAGVYAESHQVPGQP
jgi:putative copper export protein